MRWYWRMASHRARSWYGVPHGEAIRDSWETTLQPLTPAQQDLVAYHYPRAMKECGSLAGRYPNIPSIDIVGEAHVALMQTVSRPLSGPTANTWIWLRTSIRTRVSRLAAKRATGRSTGFQRGNGRVRELSIKTNGCASRGCHDDREYAPEQLRQQAGSMPERIDAQRVLAQCKSNRDALIAVANKGYEFSLQEIADSLGVTRERARVLRNRALKQMGKS